MRTISLPHTAASVPAASLYLIVAMACQTTIFSQAQLRKDFNRSEHPNFYNENSQLNYAGDLFCIVSNGKELWKSPGTHSGTERVRVLRIIQSLGLIGDLLNFSATDRTAFEVFKSDGTYSGTVRVELSHINWPAT